MYTTRNFKTKKQLKEAVARYLALKEPKGEKYSSEPAENPVPVTLYTPGLGSPKDNGTEYVEGPHYPQAHTWYAEVTVVDGVVVKVK